jgi:hypothetical protein
LIYFFVGVMVTGHDVMGLRGVGQGNEEEDKEERRCYE